MHKIDGHILRLCVDGHARGSTCVNHMPSINIFSTSKFHQQVIQYIVMVSGGLNQYTTNYW